MNGFSVFGTLWITPEGVLVAYSVCLLLAAGTDLFSSVRSGNFGLDPARPRRILGWSVLLFVGLIIVLILLALLMWIFQHIWLGAAPLL